VNVQSEKLAALLAYVQADGRICPQPQRWNELWEMLSDMSQTGHERLFRTTNDIPTLTRYFGR